MVDWLAGVKLCLIKWPVCVLYELYPVYPVACRVDHMWPLLWQQTFVWLVFDKALSMNFSRISINVFNDVLIN